MGAVKLDINSGAAIANNANYIGGAVNTSPKPSFSSSAIVDGLKDAVASRAVSVGVKTVLPRLNPFLGVASIAYEGAKLVYDKYEENNVPAVSVVKILNPKDDEELDIETVAKNFAEYQGAKLTELDVSLEGIGNNLITSPTHTLPKTMVDNTLALVQSINALTLSFQENLGYVANGIFGISSYLAQLVTLKQTQMSFNEQVEAVKLEKVELQKENYQFNKTVKSVYDLDGRLVGDFAPREARLVKDATIAIDTTDKINFSLDDIINDVDFNDAFVIPDLLGFPLGSDIISEYIQGLRGL